MMVTPCFMPPGLFLVTPVLTFEIDTFVIVGGDILSIRVSISILVSLLLDFSLFCLDSAVRGGALLPIPSRFLLRRAIIIVLSKYAFVIIKIEKGIT